MNLLARHYRRYPAFANALQYRYRTYNQELARIAQLEREGRLFVLAPKEPLAIHRTESDPAILAHLYELGYQTFYERFPALQAYLQA